MTTKVIRFSWASFGILLLTLVCGGVFAAQPETRTFQIKVDFAGHQDWRNPPQWYKGSTLQHFSLSTELYSNGKLHAANLLEVDMPLRLQIKAEFQRQRGLTALSAKGIDVTPEGLQDRVSAQMDQEISECQQDINCVSRVSLEYAGLLSASMAPDNSHLFEGEPRYAYYFPFEGCKGDLDGRISISVKGETNRSKLRKKKKVFPFELEMTGVHHVPVEQQGRMLCSFFLIVVDTKTQRMYVENVLFPQIRGTEDRLEFEQRTQNDNASVPAVSPLQPWVNANLREAAPFSGRLTEILQLPLPLDGNATILGKFEGEGEAKMEWSFD